MTATARDFAFWLQGFLAGNSTSITDEQAASIKSNLQFLFENELSPPKGKKSSAQIEKTVA